MHALNIMWLLNEVDCNTEVEILTGKSKHVDSIMISTNDFEFSISECGTCVLTYLDQPKSVEKDIEYWNMVKTWVKKYYQEILMQSRQSHYTIAYDDFNDSFLCIINGETISANFVGEILSYIAKLYDFEPKIIYSESHYVKVLENELNITIEIKD